jgi:RNA polymerase sigma factor (sigma-70 family)
VDDRADPGDDALAERVRAGDMAAYAELWQRHAGAGRMAARQFSSIADPDDIVSEAYLQILRALQRGGGPHESFRPYLYRTVRNVALTWNQKAGPATVELDEEIPDPTDGETELVEKTITARAFRTLPERWQTILWYTEVEGMEPAEAAPYLGLTANSAAALAYRARDGLKKAWLQAHVSDLRVPPECRWTTERMGDYSRGALSPRARARFDEHLETCTRCSILVEEVDGLGGRLAAILFPVVLGGGAGAAMLAELHAHAASAPAAAATTTGDPSASGQTAAGASTAAGATTAGITTAGRLATASGPLRVFIARPAAAIVAGAAAAVLVGATAFAISTIASPSPSTPEAGNAPATSEPRDPPREADPSPSDAAPGPEPSVETQPPAIPDPVPPVARRPAPPMAAVIPPPVLPPPAPDLTPPGAPVLLSPADDTLTNDARPVFTGQGEPGATLEAAVEGTDGTLTPVGTALVAPDGSWRLQPDLSLPDGDQIIRFTQVDPAGNRSPDIATSVRIDTVAPPAPVIAPLPSPILYLPDVAGTAEPGATVTLSQGATAVGSATAGLDGTWAIPLPDLRRDGDMLTAIQTDPAGNVSVAAVTGPLVFSRPNITAPGDGAVIPSTGGSTIVTVRITGTSGLQAEVLVDGVSTGNFHDLDSTPFVGVTAPLVDGAHTIGVRYRDPATGRVGSVKQVSFTIEP